MKQLLSQARARVVRHLVLDKGTLALTIGMGGLVLLLLIGTQVLDWYWPVLLTAVSLGVGLYELRKHIPSLYQLAQGIDRRMSLADSLSTAVYFSEHPAPGLEQVCALQARSAERLATGVNLDLALPFARPRFLYPALALLAVASGLFVVRYVVIGSLDLNASLLRVALDSFFTSTPENIPDQAKLKLNARAFDPSQPDGPQQNDPSIIIPPDEEKGQPLTPQDAAASQDGGKGKPDADQQKSGDKQGDSSEKSGGDPSKDQKKGDAQDKGEDSKGEDQPSVLDKMRDALSNLMNKLGSNDGQPKNGKSGDKQKGQKQEKGDKGDPQDDQKGGGEAQTDQDQAGDQSKEAKDAKQANAPGKPSDQAASGAGENDGKKDIEAAAALKAMGKVSEMLAKRGDEVKGQVMVEVKSTKQTLRTAMTQQQGGRGEAGGEIHRDQVPLADQVFVERYFEEIRKAAGAAKGK